MILHENKKKLSVPLNIKSIKLKIFMIRVYRAIDLFAGIGGIRLGFKQAFKEHIDFVFSNDNDIFCSQTYNKNFIKPDIFHEEDITLFKIEKIPDFDILLAGFPCQPFSIAGKKKGFGDKRGILFYKLVDILRVKRPLAFMLENVKNLKSHNRGKTFLEIKKILEEDLGYTTYHKIINAVNFGLPQKRERLYIIGFKGDLGFNFPVGTDSNITIDKFLEKKPVDMKYYLSQQYLNTLKKHRERHLAKGNGFGYRIIPYNGIANTIVCGGMGKERNLVKDNIYYNAWKPGEDPFKKKNNEGIRKMTEREWARLQGFPDNFIFPVSMTQAYKQIANSVPISVVKAIAIEMKKSLITISNRGYETYENLM